MTMESERVRSLVLPHSTKSVMKGLLSGRDAITKIKSNLPPNSPEIIISLIQISGRLNS